MATPPRRSTITEAGNYAINGPTVTVTPAPANIAPLPPPPVWQQVGPSAQLDSTPPPD
jgi:hypothetical protein